MSSDAIKLRQDMWSSENIGNVQSDPYNVVSVLDNSDIKTLKM